MSQTHSKFECFGRMPNELQVGVVRETRQHPGVHFFMAYTSSRDKLNPDWTPNPPRHLRVGDWTKVGGLRGLSSSSCFLAAPACNDSYPRRLSWTDSNPSSYLLDSGLSRASHRTLKLFEVSHGLEHWESRIAEILYKHTDDAPEFPGYPEFERWLDPGHLTSEDRAELEAAPIVATIKSNGVEQEIVLFPGRDLICLQTSEDSSIDTLQLSVYNSPDFFRKTAHFSDGTTISCRTTVANVAVEFNPAWAQADPEVESEVPDSMLLRPDDVRAILRVFQKGEYQWIKQLWLIDYRIRRRDGATRLEDDIQQFYGNGCKFVEVRPDDGDWERSANRDPFTNFLYHIPEDKRSKFGVIARVPNDA